jgi:hypothetical protein
VPIEHAVPIEYEGRILDIDPADTTQARLEVCDGS